MKIIFTCILLTCGVVSANSQSECQISITSTQQWKGALKTGSSTNQVSTENFTIEPLGSGQYKISDVTVGFFSQFSIDKKVEASLTFSCFDIVPATFATEYGPLKVIDGHWDSTNNKLTLHWSIEYNQVEETSVFTLQ